MIQKPEDVETAIKKYNEDVEREIIASIKPGKWDTERNQVLLEREELHALMGAFKRWQAEVGFGPIPVGKGNKTPPSDRTLVEGWTTMARRFDLDESSYFALYSYPGGRVRRVAFRLAEKAINDPLRTPSSDQWQQHFRRNSVIPTVDLGDEFASERNVVIMPNLDLINAFDIFARPDEISNWEGFDSMKDLTWSDSMKLMQVASVALRAQHGEGKVVAESTLQNLSVTKSGLPLWTEAEMGYASKTSVTRRFAGDVHTLLVSGWNVLSGHYGEGFDPEALAKHILSVHEAGVVREVGEISQAEIPWRQRKAFEFIGQFRVGAPLKAYEAMRVQIREQVEALLVLS